MNPVFIFLLGLNAGAAAASVGPTFKVPISNNYSRISKFGTTAKVPIPPNK